MNWRQNKQSACWALNGHEGATATISSIKVNGKRRYAWCARRENGTGIGNAPTLREAQQAVADAIATMEGEG